MKIATYKAMNVGNQLMFVGESINLLPEYYEKLRKRLKIKKLLDKDFIRMGNFFDGGYIMADNFNESGIAYSFGISYDVSWDLDMAERGYDVFMYDPTIDFLMMEDHERFHFFKEGISGVEDKEKSMDTLENFIKRNGHENESNMILKMNVEGAEWGVLSTVTSETLSQFDQLIFEFHDIIRPKEMSEMNATLACLKKITKTHSLVHLHANNVGSCLILNDKILIPNILELTYVKTSNYKLVDDENIYLPIPLDCPNDNNCPDVSLGYWNKKFNNVEKKK